MYVLTTSRSTNLILGYILAFYPFTIRYAMNIEQVPWLHTEDESGSQQLVGSLFESISSFV